ncbi:MAG: TonB-dependent receptor [Bacteroidetes bacterium]|nr:TonB-dependent receptor [Bacteroidota bacterium]
MTFPTFKLNLIHIAPKAIFIFLIPAFIQINLCNAQSSVTGIIVSGKDAPITHANVLLLQSKDSSLVKGILSADDGSFVFENIPQGIYLVTSSFTGFKQFYSTVFSIADNRMTNLGKLVLSESFVEMNTVTVVAKKPLYEQKQDRLVINVQNSITAAGNSALDVLERSPGVIVDRQNNSISMKGKEGVAIMINGKVNYMPASAVIELLQGMNSGSIEKIELITTPPANLDAEGHAGYINLVLKNNDHFGVNGSYSANAGYSNGAVFGGNLNMNFRQEKINIYGNLSYSRVQKPLPIYLHARFSNDRNIFDNSFATDRSETIGNFNGRIGLDYQLNKKTVFGILISGYDNHYAQSENTNAYMLKNNQLDTFAKQSNSELNHWQNISINLNMQHDFSESSRLSANVDYIYYKNNQPVHYYSAFYDNVNKFIYDQKKISTKSTPINFWIGALDYSKKIYGNLTLDAGVKATIADFYNDLGVETFQQGEWISDPSLAGHYTMNENYSAAYTSVDWALNKNTHAKMGLRYEYTNTNLGSAQIKNIVDRHYGNLFPVVTISHSINDDNTISLSYNMRISRPTFNSLAPYIYYVNANTVITGNQALQPSISNTIAVDYSYKKYVLSLSFTNESNTIAIFQPSIDSATGKVILRPENIDNQKLASAMITIPIEVNSWWSMQYSVTGSWQQIVTAITKPLNKNFMNVNINASQTFKLPKSFSLELSGFYQSRLMEGIYVQDAYGALNFGIRKKLAGTKGAIIFSANNILVTNDKILHANYPGQNLVTDLHIRFNQRVFSLTYSRSFGNNKIKEKRERTTGAEDEKGRVQ